jgi:hypothetical protein
MADNDLEKSQAETSGDAGENGTAATPTYHAPTLTSFGALAELVQVNPSTGPDGGTGDCQHN